MRCILPGLDGLPYELYFHMPVFYSFLDNYLLQLTADWKLLQMSGSESSETAEKRYKEGIHSGTFSANNSAQYKVEIFSNMLAKRLVTCHP